MSPLLSLLLLLPLLLLLLFLLFSSLLAPSFSPRSVSSMRSISIARSAS